MADLFNNFPSWGETGEYPSSGFFYEGGDQVNEKHMDALWNGVKSHIDNLNTGIRDRIRDISGDVVLDQGLAASTGSGTREVDVTASSAGAYVDGQKTGSTSATTLTHTANGGLSTRTDVVWVDTSGNVGKTEGTDTPASDRMKLAEVDVATDDTISAVRNYARDHRFLIASENSLSSPEPGDLWQDLTNSREKVYQNGDWRTLVTEEDDLQFNANDGLDGGGSFDPVNGYTVGFTVDVTDLLSTGITEDGSNNLELDESVIKDGGAKEIDAEEFAGGNGANEQVLQTDGTNASWQTINTVSKFDQESNISGLSEGDIAYARDTNQIFVEDGI